MYILYYIYGNIYCISPYYYYIIPTGPTGTTTVATTVTTVLYYLVLVLPAAVHCHYKTVLYLTSRINPFHSLYSTTACTISTQYRSSLVSPPVSSPTGTIQQYTPSLLLHYCYSICASQLSYQVWGLYTSNLTHTHLCKPNL